MLLLILATPGVSQDPSKTLGKVNIASPNSASLGKYVDIPVSYHTGVPNVSIPLYTLSSGSVNLPLSLSYHASGLRVEENDSWVGAGWTLNAGGAITRTVKDKPDEKQTTSLAQTHGHFSDYGFMSNYAINGPQGESTFDSEPDLFFFNFNGYSGKFYFNDDRTPMIVPEQDLKIEYNYTPGIWTTSPGTSAGLGRCIESFTITTPDGTKYYFGMTQSVVSSPYCDPIEVTSTMTALSGTSYSQVISSWYLNKIVSLDGNSSIALQYQRDKYAFYTFMNPTIFTLDNSPTSYKYQLVKNFVAGVRLSKITSNNEVIDFNTGSARQDLSRWTSGVDEAMTDNINQSSSTLGNITISDIQSNCLKKYNLSYDYFTDNTSTVHSNFSGVTSDKKRLKLLSVQEQSCDGGFMTPAYTFDYFTEQVPRKLSFSRDHWGYNNGITTNTQLYPQLSDNNGELNTANNLGTANRESVWPAMRAGTLSKITYPTGGYASFDFEANKFYIVENGSNVEKTVGGLRIKTITAYDPSAAKSIVTNYSYNDPSTGLSSGALYSKPVYIQLFRNDWYKKTNIWGNASGNGCWDNLNASSSSYRPYIFSDSPLRPMETTQGNHIGYEQVKATQTGNGYSVYKFTVSSQQVMHDNLAVTKITNPGTCDISITNYPAAPIANDFYRGEPSSESHYNENGQILSEKIYSLTFQENPVTTPGRLTFSFTTNNPGGNPNTFIAETFYELKTAHKTQSTITEKTYQPGGGMLTNQVQSLYESSYHHEPTRIITTDSKGQTVEKKLKYAFDYRVPLFDTVSSCYTGAASFLAYFDNIFINNGYAAQFSTCSGYSYSCYGTNLQSFLSAICNARKNYVDCRKTKFTNQYTSTTALNTYQTNHNTAKANADAELKPILWMQDINMNGEIETSSWKNNQLLNASYSKYNNNRDDEFGVYPEKSQSIDLTTPSASFTASAVNAGGTSITRDGRYSDVTLIDFTTGNVINVLGREGVPSAYDWAYNKNLPVVKIANASNKYKETLQGGTVNKGYSSQLGPANPSFSTQVNFTQTSIGTITISLPTPPPSAQVTGYYTLTGPNNFNANATLCSTGSGGPSCNGVLSSVTFSSMPVGSYVLSFTASTSFSSYTFNYSFNYSYSGMTVVSSGLKEFFFESFEEAVGATVGNAHTGKNFYNSNYTNSFTIPNGRSYTIQWWNFSNSKWNYNSQSYTNGMVLTGPVDDIRIFPNDALMTTYTYNFSGTMSSETDPRGRTLYYVYDNLNRLVLIKDNENNAVKKICYNYAGQPGNCTLTGVAMYYNAVLNQSFTRNNCSAGYIGSQVTYTVPAGTYSSTISQGDADTQAQTDVNINGQNYANANGTCIQMFNVTGSNSKNKNYTVNFYNTGTSTNYSFTLNAFASNVTLGQVPAGTYQVSFSPQGSPITANFNVNGFIQTGVQFPVFYNISVNANATVSVY
jgi:hypothetical protein